MRLKQAAQSVHQFQRITLYAALDEAQRALQTGENCDVIFISERIAKQEAQAFMASARGMKNSQDAAFIILLSSSENEGARTAQSVLQGYDGCLAEPYSVDALVEITELAAKVKNQHQQERERAAIQFLVKDIMKHIDRLAYIRSCKMDVGLTLKRLKEACEAFEHFDENSLHTYFDSALDLFENAPPGGAIGEKTAYRGVSSRIKKKMVQRLLDQEEHEAARSRQKIKR